jgi:glycosyltransferase involved in cell wall biosynthesis
VQIVLCAGAPDTPEIASEMAKLVEDVRQRSAAKIVWIDQMLPKAQLITLYSHAAVFVCPSVYEPFGIINLEAMACETPIVASKVGGIPEIVVDGETGLLVSFDTDRPGTFEPRNPERFSEQLAASVNELMRDPERRERMGKAARARVLERFTWSSVAQRTLDFYHDLLGSSSRV